MGKRPVAIKEVIDGVIKNLGQGRAMQAQVLKDSWIKAVGDNALKHAKPVDFKDGVLIIHVDSSSWLHKLTMEKSKIFARVKDDVGGDVIKDIKLRIGEL